jgi:[ribosomal protein S5]-alanine N-acetyltransferase
MLNKEVQMSINMEINNIVFEKFPEIEGERLKFRKFKIEDAADLFIIRSDEKVMNYMDSKRFTSIADAEEMIMNIYNDYVTGRGINWIIFLKDSGDIIGYFGFWRIVAEHCRAEIGFALKPEYWGKGYMTDTLLSMIRFGFNELRLHSIEANVNPRNESCRSLLEKAGFKKEAYFKENYLFNGKYYDSIIYSILENEFNNK